MPSIFPHERVAKALNHQEPDRVPIAIGGSAQKFDDPILIELLDYYGISKKRLEYVFAGFRFTYIYLENN